MADTHRPFVPLTFSCPRCAKTFSSKSRVQNHLGQPNSRCRYLFEDVVHFNRGVNFAPSGDAPLVSPQEDFSMSEISEQHTTGIDTIRMISAQSPGNRNEATPETVSSSKPQSPFYTEYFPNASHVFGKSKNFMDCFNEDQHRSQRTHNTYYPFASQGEWQLALFLLKSALSMSALDEFLKLDMVSKYLRPLVGTHKTICL